MADRGTDVLSYAEMIHRQAAEDVARWRAHGMTRLHVLGGSVGGDGDGGWAVYQLVGVYVDKQDALDACEQPGRLAIHVTALSPDPPAAP